MSAIRTLSLSALIVAVAGCSGGAPVAANRPEIKQPGKPAGDPPEVPPPSADAAQVPPGFRVEIALDHLNYPTSIDFDDEGNAYVAEAGMMDGDPVAAARVLKIAWKDGRAGERKVLVDNLSAPVTDILWHQGKLYISHKGRISVFENGRVRDIVTGLPSHGDHSNNQLSIGPDGKLYFGQGSATNSGVVGIDNFMFGWMAYDREAHDVPARDIVLSGGSFSTPDPFRMLTEAKLSTVHTSAFQPFGRTVPEGAVVHGEARANGAILKCDLNGGNLEVFAWGLRNPFGVQWSPDGKLFVAENNYDERGSRPVANAPECLHIIRPGGWYGWPDYVAGIPVTDARFRPKEGPAPEFLMAEHPPVEKPFMVFEPHASLCKIDFSKGAAFGPSGSLFLATSGDYAPVTAFDQRRAGFYVARVNPASGLKERFFHTKTDRLGPKDLEYVVTAGPKRLIDVRFSRDGGALYVVDYGAVAFVRTAIGPQAHPYPDSGVVWKITADQPAPAGSQ